MDRCFIFLILIGYCLMSHDVSKIAAEDDGSPQVASTGNFGHWSIALHGGAGRDPATWDEDKRNGRLAGLDAALKAGVEGLEKGASALDTVEHVIQVLENDSRFNAGRGAVLTTAGNAELDASIMDGATARCGAVGGVTNARNPITLARLVMTETPHVLLVGAGANEFAKQQAAQGRVELVSADYFLSRFMRQSNVDVSFESESTPTPIVDDEPHFGTVGCVVRDAQGNLAAGTSTGGTTQKLPGRLGDSPIVGAGTYAANAWCAVSGTGIGEEYIRHAVAYDIAAQMRYAERSLEEAVTRVMQVTLQPNTGGLIAIDREGTIILHHNTPGMSCGAADSRGRFEVHLSLPQRAPEN